MKKINDSEYCCDKCNTKVSIPYPKYPPHWLKVKIEQSTDTPCLIGDTLSASKDYCDSCAASILDILQASLKSRLVKWSGVGA